MFHGLCALENVRRGNLIFVRVSWYVYFVWNFSRVLALVSIKNVYSFVCENQEFFHNRKWEKFILNTWINNNRNWMYGYQHKHTLNSIHNNT